MARLVLGFAIWGLLTFSHLAFFNSEHDLRRPFSWFLPMPHNHPRLEHELRFKFFRLCWETGGWSKGS